MYDGRSMHGVSDVDPMEALDLSRLTGRLVALATIFKQLAAGSDDYEKLAKKANEIYQDKT